jgi:hypothetical protein
MNIKKSEFDSALVMLGKAISLGETNNDSIGKIFEAISGIKEGFGDLPCAVNDKRIKDVEAWKATCNDEKSEQKLEKYRGSISLKNAIILIVITNLFSIVVTLLTNYIMMGKP